MRLLIVSMAAFAAVAFAAPSFAQDQVQPAPTAKPKGATVASCNKIKNSAQRNACLKNIKVAKAQPTKKAKKPTAAPKSPDVGHLSAPGPAAAPAGPVAVPPLPSKTI
jgi:hypothetical protein